MHKPIRFAMSLAFIGIFISLLAGFAVFKSHGQSDLFQDRSLNNNAVEFGTSPEQTELAVDDGTFEATFGRTDGALSWRVNRLTPTSHPATINSVSIYFTSNSRMSVGTPLMILYGVNPGGGANINGIQLQTKEATVQALGAFNVFEIPPITANAGDFVVGYRIAAADIYPFATDTTPPSQRRSYRSFDGATYTIVDDVSQTNAGNYGIRARLQTQTSNGQFTPGDVFVSINNGRIQWRRSDGALVQTLDTGEGGFMTGMAFDKDANLYATSFERNKIHRFSPAGLLLGTFGNGYNSSPESIVFDRARNVYVGQADGSGRILKFNADGNLLATFTPAREGRGTDWIELAEDQCTMFYTSEGRSVKRFNVCTNTQLPDFVTRLPGSSSRKAFALRLLPSASGGGLIVGDTEEIVRLDATGNVVGAYDAAEENTWFAINLDPDGKSFWSAGEFTGNVYKFDLATRNQLMSFNTGTPPASTGQFVDGLVILGEITTGGPQADLAVTKTSSPNPVATGSNLTYRITVTNNGPNTANSVTVTDNLPAGMTFVSCNATSSGVCGGTGNNRTITFNSLASGASTTITLVAAVNCSGGTQITNTAEVKSALSDPNSGNNSATASNAVTGCNCTYSINPASQNFPASGGSGSVTVSTQANCSWTAATSDAWIRISSGGTGAGNGAVNFSVEANNGANPRSGSIQIAGQTFTVLQAGIVQPPSGGAVIIDGTRVDGSASGGVNRNGWLYMQKALENLAARVSPETAKVVVDLGSSSLTARNAINSAYNLSLLPDAGWTLRHVDGAANITNWLTNISTANTGILYIPTYNLATGDLDEAELAAINAQAGRIAGFVNNGGALFAMGEVDATGRTGSWGWLRALYPGIVVIDVSDAGVTRNITLTPDGMAAFPGLANADLTGTVRWVNYFVGDLGNLKVLATASQGANTRQVILGGARTPSPCPEITSFNPTSGSAGTNVTITGRGFTGVNSVKFANNVTATFTVNSDTQITATVPGGAVTGPITISKPNCADVQTGMFTIGPCIAVSIPPNLTGSPNGALTVPINVSDTTGRNALSYDAVLTFDSSVLRLQNPPFDRSGTLSANMTVTTNSPTAGRLNISGFGSNALTGAGALLNLKFDVIGSPNACSDLNWTSFRFNEGTPCSTTSNGRVCVTPDGGSIAGMVNYCAANPPKPVPGATITAAGAPQRSATTDGSGRYQLPNLGAGPYTVTPAKTGDANGITSFDAAQIAQHVVQIITLNPCQQAAADTSGNGEITSFDAAFIAQYVVGITNPDNKTGTWKFLPPTRSYASVNGNQTGQNFDAVLMGELTGNWTPGGGNTLLASQSLTNKPALSPTQVAISLPQVPAATGSSITIPITVGDLTGRNFISFDFDLTYDAAVLQAQPQPTDATDTLSRNLTITANATPGRLRVSGFGAQAMAGAGTLIKLKFTVAGAAGTGTALAWQRFLFNETPQTSLVNGRVNAALAVTSVSAASFKPESAAESIVAAFGASLATTTTTASALPLPTSLAGTTVKVKDSAGVERLAPLFFVAPTQVNYLAPPEAAPGAATVAITSGNGTVSVGTINIATVAPGLFAANADGQGVGAMVVARVRPDGSQVFESAVRFDPAQNKFVAAPIDLGAENEQVVLLIFGTGFRHRSAPSVVSVSIGGVNAQVDYAGPQPDFAGLDQLNARLPRSLAGRGEVDIVVTVDGKTANTIKIFVK